MEFCVDTYGNKYTIVSKYDGPNTVQFSGTPSSFEKFWGIPVGVVKNIFLQHGGAYDNIYCFSTEDEANAALTMLTLLRRE